MNIALWVFVLLVQRDKPFLSKIPKGLYYIVEISLLVIKYLIFMGLRRGNLKMYFWWVLACRTQSTSRFYDINANPFIWINLQNQTQINRLDRQRSMEQSIIMNIINYHDQSKTIPIPTPNTTTKTFINSFFSITKTSSVICNNA